MLIYLLICTQIFHYIIAEVHNDPSFDQSEPNSSQHIWHSYKFNTGAGNREELYFSNVGLNKNLESITGVFMWKSLPIKEQIVIVGLGDCFLTVTTLNEESNNSQTHKEELQGSAKALALFQKWDAKTQGIESFAVVATQTTEVNYTLKWYQILNGRLKFLWDWPFHGNISHLDIVKINYESKLLIVNHKGNHKNPSAEIYSFNLTQDIDIWLFEKIILDTIPSSVSVFDNNDNIFFSASFPSLEMIHIFRYTKSLCLNTLEKKHFVSHQKIFSTGLKSLISFRVGFRWYLAVASKTSIIYFIGENLSFQPVNSLNLGSFNNWLAVPVDTYREDSILLADSDSDISVISWTGDERLEVLGSFCQFACGDDANCLERMKKIALNESAAFGYNGFQNVILSTEKRSPLFFKLLIKLKPLPDKVTLKLKDILNMKKAFEENYTNQAAKVNQLLRERESFSEIESSSFSTETFKARKIPETASQTKNLSIIASDVNRLKDVVEELSGDVNEFLTQLKTDILPQNGQDSNAFLKNNVTDGITFYGDVLISELNLSAINGYDVNELFADSFRKNRVSKIGGKKTLKNLNTENIIFEKLGSTFACDIVFSDDPWEDNNRNIINGDIILQSKLNILNDVMIAPELSNGSLPLGKIQREAPKHVYDELNVEELDVTEDTYIQRTINGQPFILPVHGVQLDILDVVNQARIEIVNVKEDLNVGFINGKNFTHLLENLVLKQSTQRRIEKLKIDGLFSAPVVHTDLLNRINLTSGTPEFYEDGSQPLLESDPNFYIVEKNLKSSGNPNLKRVIHVFQNLEVDGVVFSKKINNISWAFFNDTVRKNEEFVSLPGAKNFEKVLKTTKTNLNGTLNGRFADNILTKHSNQIIRFPQVFDIISLKNLALKGAWDGVSINELNESVLRLSSHNGQSANLTFEDGCLVNVLNVTDFVNNVNVRGENSYRKIGNDKIELKTIKAANITLHGSLVTNNKINNVNLSNFSLLRVSLKSPETVEQSLIHPNVTVFGDLNLETLNLNDVSSIINSVGDTNLIEKFLNGEINRIKKLLVKGNITADQGINGHNVSKIIEKGVSITKPGSMKGNITFENIIYFDNINVTGSIDGFSLKKLDKDIAYQHSHVFLTAPKNFSTVIVTKNMKARSLNGHLVQDVASLKGDETMKGPVQINGDVIVKGNITSYAAINNLTVPDLLRTFSTKFNSFIYSGDLNLKNEHVTIRNLEVDGNIQNVSLNALLKDAVPKEESFSITGKKTFTGEVKFKENVLVEGLNHGVNFTNFYPDLVFLNKPTKLKGTFVIKEAVLKVLETTGHFNSTLINNVDTNDWLEDSVPLERYEIVNGRKFFEDAHVLEDVSVDFINGHLPTAMVPLKSKQYIPTFALFPRIHTTSDLSVAGTVNGRNLMKQYQDTVLMYGDQKINGKTQFDNDFVVNGNLFMDSIKGKPVNRLITLDREQRITTPLEFKGLVTAKKDVEELKIINNININDWAQNSVLLDREQVLNGLWTVKGKVKTKNINGEGLFHEVSLRNVSKDLRKGRLMALEIKNETQMEYSEQCHKVEELSKQFSKLPYLFYQFEVSHEIETPSVIDSVITFKINGENHLIVTFLNECLSELYKWKPSIGTFDYLRQMNIGSVSKWSVIYGNAATYLITSSFRSSRNCEENLNGGNVWVFKNYSEKYTHLLTSSAFVDIIHENETSREFFTIDDSGILQQWTLEKDGNVSSKFLLNIGPGSYRFIDFSVMGGLAISNGREIKQVTLTDDKVIENNVSFMNTQIVPLTIEGKILIAVVVKDKIIVYENILEEKIYSVIHIHRPGSVLWFNYGPEKQAFLIVASHHKLIEVYEYKSVAGLVKTVSIQMFSLRLQSETLPAKERYQSDKFVIVIQKKKLIFVKADMLGNFYKTDSFC